MRHDPRAALLRAAFVGSLILALPAWAEPDRLTLQEAFARALSDDPGVKAATEATAAAAAGVRQATRPPNPTIDLLSENIAGSDLYRAFDQAETTLSLSQPIELGGDRGARRALAQREHDAKRIGADLRKVDLLYEVELSFVEAQVAEKSLVIANEQLSLARELAGAVARRVSAARDPRMAAARAEAGVANAEAEAERARLSTVAARAKLASYWAGADDFPGVDLVSFERLAPVALTSNTTVPDVALLEAEAERAGATVAIERARAVPDPRVSAGVRKFEGTSDTAWIVGLSLPLPVFDGNGAAIARAKAERARAAYEVEAGKRALARRMTSLASEGDAARAEAQALAERVIPRGEEAFDRALEGYRMGGFSYLDVIEAQRALSDFKLKRISALAAFHRAQAALARLNGSRVSQFNAGE